MEEFNPVTFFWQLWEKVQVLAPQVIDFFFTDSIIGGVPTWTLLVGLAVIASIVRAVI